MRLSTRDGNMIMTPAAGDSRCTAAIDLILTSVRPR